MTDSQFSDQERKEHLAEINHLENQRKEVLSAIAKMESGEEPEEEQDEDEEVQELDFLDGKSPEELQELKIKTHKSLIQARFKAKNSKQARTRSRWSSEVVKLQSLIDAIELKLNE